MRPLLIIAAIFLSFSSFAQQKELLYTADMKLTNNIKDAYYVGTLVKKDGLWFRELWFAFQRSIASQAYFKDEDMKIQHGAYWSFHTNRKLKASGKYIDGSKEGTWLRYHFTGELSDSSTFSKGSYNGVQLSFFREGDIADSSNYDGKGNGATVGWHRNGNIARAGLWSMDTVKIGNWKYYDEEGKLLATEIYQEGKVKDWSCFAPNGDATDTTLCKTREATFPGEKEGWKKFLIRNLNASAPIDNGAPAGRYTVVVEFEVEKDGTLSNIRPLTDHGYGMEKEVLRLMDKSPKWEHGLRFGRPAKNYLRQPVTFIVSEQ